MTILDIPRQIDALIKGFIQFVYSICATLFDLYRRPVRSALRQASAAAPRIGSQTLLLVVCATLPFLPVSTDRVTQNDVMGGLLSGGGSASLPLYLFYVAIIYLPADMAALLLGALAHRRRRRRERAQAMLRYGLAATLASCWLAAAVFWICFYGLGVGLGLGLGSLPYAYYGAVGVLVLGCGPVALIGYPLFRPRLPAHRLGGGLLYLTLALALCCGVIWSLPRLGDGVSGLTQAAFADGGPMIDVRSTLLEVDDKGRLNVVLGVENRTPKPYFLSQIAVYCYIAGNPPPFSAEFVARPERTMALLESRKAAVVTASAAVDPAQLADLIGKASCVVTPSAHGDYEIRVRKAPRDDSESPGATFHVGRAPAQAAAEPSPARPGSP